MGTGSLGKSHVVTIGGGTGSSILLRGLNEYADRLDISAIVTTFDDGGSSGKLSREYGVPALGDIRRCVASLLPDVRDRSYMRDMFEFRFHVAKRFKGDAFGNLLLLAAVQRYGGLIAGVDGLASELHMNGRVIPVSEEPSALCAVLKNGTAIKGETKIDAQAGANRNFDRVYLEPPVAANPAALRAIESADVIVLGPGDLFTSVIPNLLPTGMIQALHRSSANILQICNIASRRDDAALRSVSDFVTTANFYINSAPDIQSEKRQVDAIIVDETADDLHRPFMPIERDEQLNHLVRSVISRPLADVANLRNHDSAKLASTVMEYVEEVVSRR